VRREVLRRPGQPRAALEQTREEEEEEGGRRRTRGRRGRRRALGSLG
jgi:hypothetical protein